MTRLHFDYETRSEIDLKKRGLDIYSADPSTEVIMCSYRFNRGPVKQWTIEDGPDLPEEFTDAVADPAVEKWAFNSQFERIITKRVLGIDAGYKNWRCAMVLAYMQGFTGNLGAVGEQMSLSMDHVKSKDGGRLIKKFSMPQRVTVKSPLKWRDAWTDPIDWMLYKDYNIQDTIAESDGIWKNLAGYEIPQFEWDLYEIDQQINDFGMPIDRQFVRNAIWMGRERKAELTEELSAITGLRNVNSVQQFLPWLIERGYPFDDLQKDTVKKVLTENAEAAKVQVEHLDEEYDEAETNDHGFITKDCWDALKLRQQVARTSIAKYDALERLTGEGNRFRFGIQFHGAQRTGRDAGRGFQAQNLMRTPKEMDISKAAEEDGMDPATHVNLCCDLIREGDYEGLKLYVNEPMNALAGLVRSAIAVDPDEDEEMMAADLASIETVTIAWSSKCLRLLNVFANKLDAYKDFAQILYNVAYEAVTKRQRQDAKPAVLGAGFRLGGGALEDGKRTGLWGYAESMGVNLTQEDSHKAVKVFRQAYPEIPLMWYALENAVETAMRAKRPVQPHFRAGSRIVFVPVLFEYVKPYMTIKLPSGRRLFYHKPRMVNRTMTGNDGKPYTKKNFSYMGKQQNGHAWIRIFSHGGKLTENLVQAIARDILMMGLKRAWDAGFRIFLRVHDELVALVRRGDNYLTLEYLIELLTQDIDWAPDMPLAAAGWQGPFYRKD